MLKKILESTLIMGSSAFLVMALDLVRVKILALWLGPEGVGTLSVLNHFHTVAVTLISLGLGTGVVKYVSAGNREGDHEAVHGVIRHAFQFTGLLSTCFTVLCVIFSSHVSGWILGSPQGSFFVIVYAGTLPLIAYTLTSSSYLQGLKRVSSLAKINLYRTVTSVLFIAPLVWFWRLEGAVLSVVIISVIHALLCHHYLKTENYLRSMFSWKALDVVMLKQLLPFGLATLITGATYALSQLVLKILIVRNLGMELNGIYQPVWALTMTYPTLVLSSMSAYSYPRLCELSSARDMTEEINAMLRVAVMLITPAMFFLVLARQPIIQVLYSPEFSAAADYIPIQILGDFFKILTWSVGAFLLPIQKFRPFVIGGIFTDGLLVAAAAALIPAFGLNGAVAAFVLSYGFSAAFHYGLGRNYIQFRLWPKNRKLLACSFGAIVGLTMCSLSLSFRASLGAGALILALWGLMTIEKAEGLKLKQFIIGKLCGNESS